MGNCWGPQEREQGLAWDGAGATCVWTEPVKMSVPAHSQTHFPPLSILHFSLEVDRNPRLAPINCPLPLSKAEVIL